MKITLTTAALCLSLATPLMAQDQTKFSDVTAVQQAQRSTCGTLETETVKEACLAGVAATDAAMRAAIEALPDEVEVEEPDTDTAAIWERYAAARDVCDAMESTARNDCVGAAIVVRQNELNGASPETAALPVEGTAPFRGWTDTSAIDDSKTVHVTYQSRETQSMQSYGSAGRLTLHMRCLENTTSLYLHHPQVFFADIQDYGRVTTRLDDANAVNRNFNESTDNGSLGLWLGGQSIPVIRTMFGKSTLTVRLTPYNESPRTFTFDIRGLESAVGELRETCNW